MKHPGQREEILRRLRRKDPKLWFREPGGKIGRDMICVVCCGRSGSCYTTKLLRLMGKDVGHERPGPDGMVGWQYAAPERWLDYGNFPHRTDYDLRRVLHQIRHPLKSLASMTWMHRGQYAFLDRQVGLLPIKPRLHCMASFWLRWNQLAESVAEWTYHIEDLREDTDTGREWLERLGVSWSGPWPDIPKNTHTKGRNPPVEWSDLDGVPWLRDAIKREAARWGYDV